MVKTPFQETIVRRTEITEQLHALEDALHPYNNIGDVSVFERGEKTIISIDVNVGTGEIRLEENRKVLDHTKGILDTIVKKDNINPDNGEVLVESSGAMIELHYLHNKNNTSPTN